MKKRNRTRSGFTLIELLVVIGIIGILGSLLLPALAKAKYRANRVKCVSNVGEIGKALALFADDHGGRYPWQLLPADQRMHFGGHSPFSTKAIVSTAAMKDLLGTPKNLWSPCDPEALPHNEKAQKEWSTYDTLKGKFINCEAMDYFFGKGATTGRPGTILVLTKNVPKLDIKGARFVGADEKNPHANAFASLNKGQGQGATAGGGATQMDDSGLQEKAKYHAESSGGIFKGPASTKLIGCCGEKPKTNKPKKPKTNKPKKPKTNKPKKPVIHVECERGGGYLTLTAVQAGTRSAIDDLRIVCLSCGKVFYQNNFNAGNLKGLRLQHSHDPRQTRLENGRLVLESAGHYEAYGRMHMEDELPKNFELSFVVNKARWTGHFEMLIYSNPSKRHVDIPLDDLLLQTNINGGKINHVSIWAHPPTPKPKGWKSIPKYIYGNAPGNHGPYAGRDVHYKLRVNKGKVTLWVDGKLLATN